MDSNLSLPTTQLPPEATREEMSPPGSGPALDRELSAHLVVSPHASATINALRTTEARRLPGVRLVLTGADLGEANRLRPLQPDEPLLADAAVHYVGQPVALIVADSPAEAAAAAAKLDPSYHTSPATIDLDQAIALQRYHGEAITISRGDPGTAIGKAPRQLEGSFDIGSQLSFPEEPLWATAWPAEDDTLIIRVPAELPSRVRAAVAAATGLPESHIEIISTRLAGLTGGRQSESAHMASLTAIAARRTGRPVRLTLPRALDLALTAKRHAMRATFTVGHDETGRVLGAELHLSLDAGHRAGDSDTALDQALLHADGAYFVSDFRVSGRLCQTHHLTGAALPAEGAAQGAMVMEEILTRVAHRLGLAPEKVREANLYRDADNRHSTPYGQPVSSDPLHRIWNDLLRQSDFHARKADIDRANAVNPCYKRGLAIVPAKFGVGDPRAERNQAMALVQLLVDGSICVRLGCVDAGDGLPRQLAATVAAQFGVAPSRVLVRGGDLHCTPHMSARLGSNTVGLLHRAVTEACESLKSRLRPVAAQLLAAAGVTEIDAETIRFADGKVGAGAHASSTLDFGDLVEAAWRRRTNMSAIGFHRTPNLWWDREVGAGWPFTGFVFGAAVVEAQLDAFTGEIQVLRVDLLHQGHATGDREHDRAQIIRAFQMGLGWQLREVVDWTDDGALRQDSARLSGIPGHTDAPLRWRVDLVPAPNQPAEFAATSGAESAVFLAAAAREAAREAIRAFGAPIDPTIEIHLPAPATPPTVLAALRAMSAKLAAKPEG